MRGAAKPQRIQSGLRPQSSCLGDTLIAALARASHVPAFDPFAASRLRAVWNTCRRRRWSEGAGGAARDRRKARYFAPTTLRLNDGLTRFFERFAFGSIMSFAENFSKRGSVVFGGAAFGPRASDA